MSTKNTLKKVFIVCLVTLLVCSLVINTLLFVRYYRQQTILRDNLLVPVATISSESHSLKGYCSRAVIDYSEFESIQETLWFKTNQLFLAFDSLRIQTNQLHPVENLASSYDAFLFSEISVILSICQDIWHNYDHLNSDEQKVFVLFYRQIIDDIYAVFGQFPEIRQSINQLKDAISYVDHQLFILLDLMESQDISEYFYENINELSSSAE